jgi:uncharacterized protein YqfA (UPF0365 family)
MAKKAGIVIQSEKLEAHSKAGGNVEKVMKEMIMAKKKHVRLSFKEACEMDLAHKDFTKEIQNFSGK